MSDNTASPTISGADIALMDASASSVADTGPPAGSREAELAAMAASAPGVYRWSDGGKLAGEHLALKRARVGDGEADTPARRHGPSKASIAEDAPDADDASAAGRKYIEQMREERLKAEAEDDGAGDDDAGEADDYSTDATDEKLATPADVPTDPAERAEYLPDDASGYDAPAVEGVTWGKADQPTLEGFYKAAHELEMPQGHVDKLAGWYIGRVAEIKEGWKQADAELAKATRASLSQEDFEAANVGWKGLLTKTERAQARQTRGPDGRAVVNQPWFAKLMAQAARAQQQGDAAPTNMSADEARTRSAQRDYA